VSPSTALALAVLLLLLNAFFVGAEFAVISARRSQIEPMAEAGRRSARTTLWAMEHVSLMLACAQLGITVASLGLGAVAEPALAHLLEPAFEAARLPEALVHPVAFALALVVVVYLHVVVGEMVPKNLAIAGPERAALVLAPPLVAVARGLRPLIAVLSGMTSVLLRLLRVEQKEELTSAFTAEEVQSIVAESRREGLLEDEHGLLTGALELGERVAGDVLVPLDRLVTVPRGSTPEQVERVVARTGFSRFPVVAGPGDDRPVIAVRTVPEETEETEEPGADDGPVTVSDPGVSVVDTPRHEQNGSGTPSPALVGYLHVKDLLYADDQRHSRPVPDKRIRALVSVAVDDHVEEALSAMRRTGSHLARVVAPDGRTVGVLFLEDVIEELVGEVSDATQRREAQVKATSSR
jgi:CBS domain containing-hemolysin-like protein